VGTIDTALVECISTALVVTRGRIYGDAGAAKLLGLKPSTLQSKMRKLGIERARFVA
jgi:transcriptional regulator with GAF, ATPase, and Fis domain